jgi:hypothetical protein
MTLQEFVVRYDWWRDLGVWGEKRKKKSNQVGASPEHPQDTSISKLTW